MTVIKKADGASGTMAIYTSGAGDAPFDNPTEHLSKIRFHSSLLLPVIQTTLSGSITLPAIPNPGYGQRITAYHSIGVHGQPGPPLVTGGITLDGQNIGMCGTVPASFVGVALGVSRGFGRYLEFAVDGSNVYIVSISLTPDNAVPWSSVPAVTFNYTCYVTSLNLNNPNPIPVPTNYTMQETPNLVEYGRGRFRSDKRFLRASPTGPINFAVGPTASINSVNFSDGKLAKWAFTWELAGVVRQMTGINYSGGSSGGAINGPAHSTPVQTVKV